MKPGWCFPDGKKSNNIITERKLQCPWPEIEKGLQRFHYSEWMHKETKDLAGNREWRIQSAITEHNPFICSLGRLCDTAFPSSPTSVCTQQQLRVELFFLSHLYLGHCAMFSNGMFKCILHGKMQLLPLALYWVVTLRIKDQIRSRLQAAQQ